VRTSRKFTNFSKKQQPAAAQRQVSAIEWRISWLADFPYMAPATDEAGVRELTLARHPYKIYYEVAGEEVRILHSRHVRRRPRERKR
jgi:plasmid stabilization system protein ParE